MVDEWAFEVLLVGWLATCTILERRTFWLWMAWTVVEIYALGDDVISKSESSRQLFMYRMWCMLM